MPVAKSAAVKASNWFHIVAAQLGMSGEELHDALEDEVSKDALRDLIGAARKPQSKTLDKIQAAVSELRKQRVADGLMPGSTIPISHSDYRKNSPLQVIKRPMSLADEVIAKDQRRRINENYAGVYDLYRKESGPAAYIRDKLVIHRLFRNQFPITLISYLPDGHAANPANTRTYRGYSYFNNTVMSGILGRPSEQRRFDMCTLFLQRTQTPKVNVLGGLLTSLTTSQGQPMATPVVLCRTPPGAIDLDFPELWQRDVDQIVSSHPFEANGDLKGKQKALLGVGDKRFLLADSAVAVEREFAGFVKT